MSRAPLNMTLARMGNPVALFRALLIISVACALVGATIDLMFENLIPLPLREAQNALTAAELTITDLVLLITGIPLIIAFVVCAVGLYRLRPWAPRACLYITIASLFLYPLIGASVVSQWSTLLTETSALLWGAVMAMAFLPPINLKFGTIRANSSSSGRDVS
jgi:hypothetical protein